ncbi:MAG TPA: PAS domain-containing protein [Rhizomicrobium sp.]|nr:PAS domain-containing protein [Rhizomicrobium sp.]
MPDHMPHVGAQLNPGALENPTLAFLRDYWEKKRGDRRMPSRADIRPSELREHLAWVIMADVLNGGEDFRYRLIGTLVTEYFLTEATGKTVRESFEKLGPAVSHAVLAVMRTTTKERAPIHAFGEADAFATSYEAFDAIFLPLSDDGENANVILHAFVFNRPEVLLARQIAKSNGGQLPQRVKSLPGAA